jgi:hypothetical protein
MSREYLIWGWMMIAVAGIVVLVATRLSSNARMRRRIRKTRGRIVSKARQPAVKFSVKTPPEDK